MTKNRVTAGLFVLLLALTALYVWIRKGDDGEVPVFGPSAAAPSRIEIRGREEILLESDSGTWKLRTADAVYPADQDRIDALVRSIGRLDYEKHIGTDVRNLETYGLEDPSVVLVLEGGDGTRNILRIGDATPSGNHRYAMTERNGAVGTIAGGFVDTLSGRALAFRDRRIAVFDGGTLTDLTVSRPGSPGFRIRKIPGSGWTIEQPLSIGADEERVMELLDAIAGLEMQSFRTYGSPPSSDPESEPVPLTLTLGDGTGNGLILSMSKTEEGMIDVLVEGRNEIYTAHDFGIDELTLDEFLFFAPLSVSADSTNQIDVVAGGASYCIQRSVAADGEEYSVNGEELPAEDYFSFYVNLMALTAEGLAADPPAGTPAISLRMTRSGGEDIAVQIHAGEGGRFIMTSSVNPYPFWVSGYKVEILNHWLERIGSPSLG